jgi:hypothetical protein
LFVFLIVFKIIVSDPPFSTSIPRKEIRQKNHYPTIEHVIVSGLGYIEMPYWHLI